MLGKDGKSRCRPCGFIFSGTGLERNLKPICRDVSHCNNDYTTYDPAKLKQSGDGIVRYRPWYTFWIDKREI